MSGWQSSVLTAFSLRMGICDGIVCVAQVNDFQQRREHAASHPVLPDALTGNGHKPTVRRRKELKRKFLNDSQERPHSRTFYQAGHMHLSCVLSCAFPGSAGPALKFPCFWCRGNYLRSYSPHIYTTWQCLVYTSGSCELCRSLPSGEPRCCQKRVGMTESWHPSHRS